MKQIPIFFGIMSGSRTRDYHDLFRVVKAELQGIYSVACIVADYEASVWEADRLNKYQRAHEY